MSDSEFIFRPVIGLWGSMADLAADIGESYVTVQQWHWRDSIPAVHFQKIVKAAQAREIEGVTLEHLLELADRRSKEGSPARRAQQAGAA